ncbi:MAG: putative spermidine/putrescine transport system ATP-binding protein [Phormidesmis priestleyi Ana]|uniref:ABC-type quaternary amine transporter n=1 Tax=Phormidesmis priestleyi Ana TaxID=1666911 RepID=A0A0P7YPP8_9CYAN|nr:MAG: putative spermidine/putrescine transport system ATP-binding protein [Phormidesmis priestleyi Ana]
MQSVQTIEAIVPEKTQSDMGSDSSHSLSLSQVMHQFGSFVALENINLDIRPGEFVSLLGPSGCGKTTLLRIISGFLTPTAGSVLIDGMSVQGLSPSQRGTGIVFQNYALFPHMSVWDNVAYGLRAAGNRSRSQIANRVGEMLNMVQLNQLAKRVPSELSGGQQQRVALARALAVEPRIMLLDEPFSALDKSLRLDMQIEIRRILSEQNITAIMVTHDQEEAMSMSDRIAVLSSGTIHQFDTPTNLYDRPATSFVSSFVGTCNHLPAEVLGRTEGGYQISIPGGELAIVSDLPLSPYDKVTLAVRPENLRVQPQCDRTITGTVTMCLPLGSLITYDVRLTDDCHVKITQTRTMGAQSLKSGDLIHLNLVNPEACAVFSA